jgi:predicted N-acyltransferase
VSDEHFRLEIIESLSEISAADWNALLTPDASPFLKYEFLSTLEETVCVGGNTGWQVAHLALYRSAQLIGAMPLYLKQHSYGCLLYTSPSPRD